jgi:hypothetical protein
MKFSIILLKIINLLLFIYIGNACKEFNFCNGHGKCSRNGTTCLCDDGWGSLNDFSNYRAPDCSARICPAGKAWSDLPKINGETAHQLAECSNQGICNRQTGRCECFPGYEGKSCNRYSCPNNCSGHGTCKSMRRLARTDDAQVLGPNFDYGRIPVSLLFS